MTDEDQEDRNRPLKGDEAVKLWRQGPESWNNFIRLYPIKEISFKGVDFSKLRDSQGKLSFNHYNFGDCDVSFMGAKFGDGDVSFSMARFGDGIVNFRLSRFGSGNIDFGAASFGNNDVYFSDVKFGNGEVDFTEATFGNGLVDFTDSIFGNGFIRFKWASFGDGGVNFIGTNFGDGGIDFSDVTFGKGSVCFYHATFGDGVVLFTETDFGDDKTDFTDVSFGKGELILNQSKFTELLFKPHTLQVVRIAAQGLLIKRLAIISIPSKEKCLESFDLQGASFDGPLFLKGELKVIPDLRATRSSHQIELSDLKVDLRRIPASKNWFKRLHAKAEAPEDTSRLRRLKEIAEANKDHQAALRFSADENRARRWVQTSKLGSILDIAFSGLSNYGQNILRPSLWLGAVFLISIGLYKAIAAATFTAFWKCPGWGPSLLLSISNSLPFLPQSRSLRDDAIEVLYSNDPSLWVDAIMIGQGALSFIFLFLIGLGLRNRFRL